jgi:hypothetical protein
MLGVAIDSEGIGRLQGMKLNQKRGSFAVERWMVQVFPDRREMGIAAGQAVAEKMRTLLKKKTQPG